MPSSPNSAVALRQKATEHVSRKGSVIAHFVQCFSILPSRFLLNKYRSYYIQTMTLGAFEGVGDRLCPPNQHLPSFLTYFKSSGLPFGERGQEKRVDVGSYTDGRVSKAWRFRNWYVGLA